MIVYRISHPDYAHDLSGYGAWSYGGRWNYKGEFVLYTSQHASLAILELLAHIRGLKQQIPYLIVTLNLGQSPVLDIRDFTYPLPANWTASENGLHVTRKIGSEWLRKSPTPVLQIPSVHSPFEYNYLINPKHPDLEIKAEETIWYLHDYRLIRVDT